MKNALILLAGGLGQRLEKTVPKQFLKIGNTNLIEYFLRYLDSSLFDIIIIASSNKHKKKYLNLIQNRFSQHNIKFSLAGKNRQSSSKNALIRLSKFNPKNVLIHDSARPLVSNKLINLLIRTLNRHESAIPFISHNDFIKSKKGLKINNNEIINIQTPQGFHFNKILNAHKICKIKNAKDDSSIYESNGKKLKMVKGEITNFKITYKSDLESFNRLKFKEYRSGIGYDIHQINFKSKKKLTLCGVKISHPPLIGHSDADVGYHAICDSILGALSMHDIGCYFNNKNMKWKNVNSKIFIKFCSTHLNKRGYKIVNLDINFICEKPNINKYSILMKNNLSNLLNISINRISIKATTNEKIGLIGKGKGIAAESIVQIVNV